MIQFQENPEKKKKKRKLMGFKQSVTQSFA